MWSFRFSLVALLTGVIQALGTPWGLFRHWWVIIKLGLTLVGISVLLEYALSMNQLAGVAASGRISGADLDLMRRSDHLDGDTATGRAYIHELARGRDGSSHLSYAIYHDRYQRTPDGWRFTERVYEVRYYDTSPLAGSAPSAAGAPGAAGAPADPAGGKATR